MSSPPSLGFLIWNTLRGFAEILIQMNYDQNDAKKWAGVVKMQHRMGLINDEHD